MSNHTPKFVISVTTILIAVGFYFVVSHRLSNPPADFPLEPMEKLPVKYIDTGIELDVEAPIWNSIEPTHLRLYPQSARNPHGTTEKAITIKAFYNNEDIYFLAEFADDTENRTLPSNPDACAILFVSADSTASAQMMGYANKANIWHWLADRDLKKYRNNESVNVVRELIAVGPATQTEMEKQNVEGRGFYKAGKWKVIFKRKLEKKQEKEFAFTTGAHKRVAFALWNGVKMESFGKKSIAILRTLVLEDKK
ncbi:MAG: hypothetical protein GY950_34045 [bacterium]|nr:hypothetical protein [bacterium]